MPTTIGQPSIFGCRLNRDVGEAPSPTSPATTDRLSVNLAARLCERAKEQRSGVLASMTTVAAAHHPDPWMETGKLRIRGRSEKAPVATIRLSRRRR